MSFFVVVDCQPRHGSEPMPHVLHSGLARVALKALVDRWDGWGHRDFKLLGEDDATYFVHHHLPSGLWELAFCDSGQGPAR